MQAQRGADICWVLEENWQVVGLLSLTVGCWRYGPDGKPIGMHYADAQAVADWHGIPPATRKLLPMAIAAIINM